MLAVRCPADTSGLDIALGWCVFSGDVVWHNGGTDGFRSFVGFYPQSRIGVVVLSMRIQLPASMTSASIC